MKKREGGCHLILNLPAVNLIDCGLQMTYELVYRVYILGVNLVISVVAAITSNTTLLSFSVNSPFPNQVCLLKNFDENLLVNCLFLWPQLEEISQFVLTQEP